MEISEKRLAGILWPGQFAEYKQLSSAAGQQPVAAKQANRLVILGHRLPLDEQQRRLKIYLDRLVDTADTGCRLNDAQREKLALAGKIDIDRFAERYHAVEGVEDDGPIKREARLSALSDRADLVFFQPDSNYQKALRTRLTAEQMQQLATADQQRHAFRRQALVEAIVVGFERSASLTSAQCVELTQALDDAVTVPDSLDDWRSTCLRMIVELPEEKLRPIFTDEQLPAIRRYLRQLDEITQQLEAEAAGKVAVFRKLKVEVKNGLGNVEMESELEELRLDIE